MTTQVGAFVQLALHILQSYYVGQRGGQGRVEAVTAGDYLF
jgi:hypothetical protein